VEMIIITVSLQFSIMWNAAFTRQWTNFPKPACIWKLDWCKISVALDGKILYFLYYTELKLFTTELVSQQIRLLFYNHYNLMPTYYLIKELFASLINRNKDQQIMEHWLMLLWLLLQMKLKSSTSKYNGCKFSLGLKNRYQLFCHFDLLPPLKTCIKPINNLFCQFCHL